jgi:hypothetical protein
MSRRSEDGRKVTHRGTRIRKNVAVMAMILAILASPSGGGGAGESAPDRVHISCLVFRYGSS